MTVPRARSAFQFFQSERLSDIRRSNTLTNGDNNSVSVNGNADTAVTNRQHQPVSVNHNNSSSSSEPMLMSMGAAMTELSKQWKALPQTERQKYLTMEAEDQARYAREAAEADRLATEEQARKREDRNVVKEGEVRGARMKMEVQKAEEDDRRRKRQQELLDRMDPQEIAEMERKKEEQRQETEERRRKKREQEKAVEARHKKIDKEQAVKANKRLEYLLSQSSIFARLKNGDHHRDVDEENEKPPGSPSRRERRLNGNSKSSDNQDTTELEDEESDYRFVTKQPSVIVGGTLKQYQVESLNWMIHLADKGLNGILADEMGLGKTLQSISILAYFYEYMNIQGPHLIVVPKSTLSNWMNELKRWCPCLRAIRFHGSREDRQFMVDNYFTHEAAAVDGRRPDKKITNEETGEMEDDNSHNPRQWDVCVTTYEVVNTEKRALGRFPWKYLVIDEAHRLKNECSIFAQTVRAFKTEHRLLLTGTPLQNNLHELWALLNFLLPDIFGSSEQFDEWFNLDIDDDDAKKNMIEQLHKILRPFMLRRLKSDVAKGLPPKTETLLMVGMSSMQKKLYKQLLLRDIEQVTGKATGKAKTAILNIVMQLRKCCGHPYLFEGVEDRTLDPLGEHLVENCGKMVLLDKLMKRLEEKGHRVLIFTQMTRVLDILEDYMHMRGFQYCRIDGNTEHEDRERSIDVFNAEGSEKFCFLLSTRAGGLGINLQTADTCILYDSDWNPQADLQAQDRCHRIGQKYPVNVYRLVTENSVEEKIVERAQQKLKLDAMVVQQGRLKDKDKLSKEDVMAAVRFGADVVFRSEESAISDEDIDAILARGKAKTKELSDKLQEAVKGDLLDFRMDGGISAQTFEGVDYGDQELRNQLKLLAADSMGKRERRAPPSSYNLVVEQKKAMVVNNNKIVLPKALRLPRMEDFQFYNRERLLELGELEFQTYAALKDMGQLPEKEYIDRCKTLLPPEMAQEKLDLLAEGFEQWTRGQYFHFIKACTQFGRQDISSIAADMNLSTELVFRYSKAFWEFGPTELKKEEWDRIVSNVEKGEVKIARKKKNNLLLGKFVKSFKDPRNDIVFANKGTVHFALEQDRALLSAVDRLEYGNWDAIRDDLLSDTSLLFNHTVQGMTCDSITKRCDYRMRQMEKELEGRERKLKGEKSAAVIAAEEVIRTIKEVDLYEDIAVEHNLRGEVAPPLLNLSLEAQSLIRERHAERVPWVNRLREIEVQVQACNSLAEETKDCIMRGTQYVNYSSITLKAGGPIGTVSANGTDVIDLEATINKVLLQISECGICDNCKDKPHFGGPGVMGVPCIRRLAEREKILTKAGPLHVTGGAVNIEGAVVKKPGPKKGSGNINNPGGSVKKEPHERKKPGPKPGQKKKPTAQMMMKIVNRKNVEVSENGAVVQSRKTSLGNKRMGVTDDMLPELCRRIGVHGTNERMKLINDFVKDHPAASARQVTFKFAELVCRKLPECAKGTFERRKGKGKTYFFLRPKFYCLLHEDERPEGWESYAVDDEKLWEEEQKQAKEKLEKEKEKEEASSVKKRPMEEVALSTSPVAQQEGKKMKIATTEVVE